MSKIVSSKIKGILFPKLATETPGKTKQLLPIRQLGNILFVLQLSSMNKKCAVWFICFPLHSTSKILHIKHYLYLC